MEENKNYNFSFEPEKTEKTLTDNNGTSKVTFQGNTAPLGGDFANNNYVIANHTFKGKKKTKNLKRPGIAKDHIGIGSSGFAGVITLASIVAIAGAVIAYLTLRY